MVNGYTPADATKTLDVAHPVPHFQQHVEIGSETARIFFDAERYSEPHD